MRARTCVCARERTSRRGVTAKTIVSRFNHLVTATANPTCTGPDKRRAQPFPRKTSTNYANVIPPNRGRGWYMPSQPRTGDRIGNRIGGGNPGKRRNEKTKTPAQPFRRSNFLRPAAFFLPDLIARTKTPLSAARTGV